MEIPYFPGATRGTDGRIYMMGGVVRGPNNHTYLTQGLSAYDPRTDRWTRLAPMPTARAGLAAATGRDGRIYAIGGSLGLLGFGGNSVPDPASRAVEAYDPRTNRWATLPSLHVPRYYLSAVAAPDGRIYAIGGKESDAVEAYTVPAPAKP